MKKSRSERDYGLPRLTVAEAARVLGLSSSVFRDWISDNVPHSEQQWINWRNEDKLPEALIRLYLTQQRERAGPIKIAEIGGATGKSGGAKRG